VLIIRQIARPATDEILGHVQGLLKRVGLMRRNFAPPQ
jgi:hypothetical protein